MLLKVPDRRNEIMSSPKLDPIISQFETVQQAETYAKWVEDKVERVLNSESKPVPHEEVIARAAKRRAELLAGLKNADWMVSGSWRWLDNIIRYIFQHNPAAAFEQEDLILSAPHKLTVWPESGRLGLVFGTRELIVHPNYMLIYRINDPVIRIIAVVHTRQNYP